jgi:hypothetical protein
MFKTLNGGLERRRKGSMKRTNTQDNKKANMNWSMLVTSVKVMGNS